jgi:hypothetical protein
MARLFVRANSEKIEIQTAAITSMPLSMACWFKPITETVLTSLMGISDGGSEYWAVQHWGNAGDQILGRSRGSGADGFAISSAGTGGSAWYHACAVFASATSRSSFLDGANKGTNADNVSPAGVDRTTIGHVGAENYADAEIGEAAVWNIALSDLDVFYLAQGISPMLIRPDALRGFWPLIDNDNDVLERGFNMARLNSPSWASHPRRVLDQYAKWENRTGLRMPYRGRLAGRFNVPWSVRAGITAIPRIPRPTAAYNNLAIY